MPYRLRFTTEARDRLAAIAADRSYKVKHRKILKTLGHLERNPRHPGLESHEYQSLTGPNGEKVWESYVENRTPRAWRIWWCYGPGREVITILAIGPHPD